ncbi:MAG: hypothetical protein R3B09_19805 [Nannocystaceae bacterium]
MTLARLGRRGLLLSAASLAFARSASAARSAASLPYFRGSSGFTGEAAVAMVLAEHAPLVDPAAVFAASGVEPGEGRGADAAGLVAAVKSLGGAAQVWDAAVVGDSDGKALWAALRALLEAGPCVLELGSGAFAVAVGISGSKLTIHDPLLGPDLRLRRRDLAARWPRAVGGGRQVRAIQIGAVDRIHPASRDERRLSALELALAARDLRGQVDGRGWPVAVTAPFVVTGDLSIEALDEVVVTLMSMALVHLRRDFFPRDPEGPITGWIFGDDASYRRNARALTGEEPETPFGYYDGARRALIINVGTGGGTLIHEMVHPLLRANFPRSPPWVDEGMASLFEQCIVRDGRLVGMTNWRLPELQLRLRAGTCPDFADLFGFDAAGFYSEDRAIHYAAARYLFYYFQENGLLQRLWRALVAGHGAEDGGLAIVGETAAALGHRDLRALRRAWESFVLGLHYP